ncbi:HAD-IIIA family hydrolase [Luteolibacter pohnpeiensis]|uniref:HAD-IIIA family hydrolase n=1 Tax=Luteolibacter pohnpeiensis TaxID=454153 RepID=A0A934VW76_9BACT|nr:HAD-IIIA family hydrolase [Luteolibacter pohnpeiensis]MBK1884332.1 HAD-IIIA family hydrolase [Luteolibacter pohnpeiensis]
MQTDTALILFDAAGTLIEPAVAVERVYQKHFSRYGWEVEEAKIRDSFHGAFASLADPDYDLADGELAERTWWAEVVGRVGSAVGIDRLHDRFEACFEELFDYYASGEAWRLFPEVLAVLSELKSSGAKLAIVSNFDRRLHRVLAELGVADCFDLVLTSADVSCRKPSPALLTAAIDYFGNSTSNVCLVGDSPAADAGAATAAGIDAFILNRPQIDLKSFEKWLKDDFFQK